MHAYGMRVRTANTIKPSEAKPCKRHISVVCMACEYVFASQSINKPRRKMRTRRPAPRGISMTLLLVPLLRLHLLQNIPSLFLSTLHQNIFIFIGAVCCRASVPFAFCGAMEMPLLIRSTTRRRRIHASLRQQDGANKTVHAHSLLTPTPATADSIEMEKSLAIYRN